MAYVPLNLNVFTAAYAGAMAGMVTGARDITDPTSGDYTTRANVAGAYAESFDTAFGAGASDSLQVEMVFLASAVYWTGRSPDPANASFTTAATYTPLCSALLAVIAAGEAFFAGQGIVPAAWGGGGGGGGTVILRKSHADSPVAAIPGVEYWVDASGGNVVFNLPVLLFQQSVTIKQDESTALGVNQIIVNAGAGQTLAEPPPNNGTFVASFTITGDAFKGTKLTWANGGSAGGKLGLD